MKQKQEELISLAVCGLFPMIVGFSIIVTICYDGVGFKAGIMMLSWLAASAFIWVVPDILHKMGLKKEVLRDERDAQIHKTAALMAHVVVWIGLLGASLLIWGRVGNGGSVPIEVLMFLCVGGVMLFQVALVIFSMVLEERGLRHG